MGSFPSILPRARGTCNLMLTSGHFLRANPSAWIIPRFTYPTEYPHLAIGHLHPPRSVPLSSLTIFNPQKILPFSRPPPFLPLPVVSPVFPRGPQLPFQCILPPDCFRVNLRKRTLTAASLPRSSSRSRVSPIPRLVESCTSARVSFSLCSRCFSGLGFPSVSEAFPDSPYRFQR